ncbi:MAG: hypothetical protein KDD66_16175, partial [Bdellovibrionales bacterium]|nr:hypothetical protein [Bdellovibrionales bacterium]
MEFQLRPTLSLLRAIASIERQAGNWDRLALNNAVTTERERSSALETCLEATLELEASIKEPIEAIDTSLASAFEREFNFGLVDIQDLYR